MNDRRLRFVLAEDNAGDVFLIRRALDSAGLLYDLFLTEDGNQALRYISRAAAEQHQVDLFLLDLNLPGHDGSQILIQLRRNSALAGLPVILLSSSDAPGERERFIELGATHFFQKPSDLARFMQIGNLASTVLAREAS